MAGLHSERIQRQRLKGTFVTKRGGRVGRRMVSLKRQGLLLDKRGQIYYFKSESRRGDARTLLEGGKDFMRERQV